ncbi:redoxin domain-containing protein [Salinimicrobium soli]|uniref:redoxin domain-containing protein n=1 Tax=Salinimicrobium soli TaxID=1254399 RepID=UPI003AB0D8CD
MRKILIVSLIALFASCEQENDQGYHISGTVENASEGQMIIISELNDTNTQTVPVDTVTVTDGKFEMDLPEKESPAISFLTLDGMRGNILYIADNTPIKFKIYTDSIYASEVTGGKDNEILYTYLGTIKSTNKKMGENRVAMREAFSQMDSVQLESLQQNQEQIMEEDKGNKIALVEKNPNSLVSVMVLQDMVNTQMYPASKLRELFDNLDPEIKETSLAQQLDETLTNLSRTDVGSPAPEFSAPTPNGEDLALKNVMGKVTLVDFWASWCKPCRVENPNLVEVYKKYHDKGFNIIQVSLDRPGQKEKWMQAIEEDNLGAWNHVSNLMFWQDPIAADYGVRAIPAAFLLDENGNIAAKNLRGEELEEKVSELVSE